MDVDDPLDPAAKGYTERFQLPQRRRQPDGNDQPLPEPRQADEKVVSPADHAGDEEDSSLANDIVAQPQGPSVADQRISSATPTAVNQAIPFEFDVEALMRRRMLVQEEVAAEVARPDSSSALPAHPDAQPDNALSSLLMGYGDDSDDEDKPSPQVDAIPQDDAEASVVMSKQKSAIVDPMVRSLVPASVLHKRPHDNKTFVSQKQRRAEHHELPQLEALEDDFNSFMSEISNLPS